MRWTFTTLILAACAQRPNLVVQTPSWVAGIRSGEESLKVKQGERSYYRRVAGHAGLSKESACELAVTKVEEDIKKEFPGLARIPYVIEVLVYDRDHRDCAVTASIASGLVQSVVVTDEMTRHHELSKLENPTEDEVTEILQLRSLAATQYAQLGVTKEEFEKFMKDKVYLYEGMGECHKAFRAPAYSIHGTTHVCWQGEHVVGYCTIPTKNCWQKTP